MWFRSLHSRNDSYFGWINNGDGTISCKNKSDLVLGYGAPKNENHWHDTANKLGWHEMQ